MSEHPISKQVEPNYDLMCVWYGEQFLTKETYDTHYAVCLHENEIT